MKYKCGKDSFSFNGSCYFISNRKQYNIGLDDAYDTLSQNLMRFANRRQQQLPRSSQVSLIDMPSEAKWQDAVENCKRLNNDSSLFTFGNNLQEYEMIKDLLIKNIFTMSSSDQKINQEFEQKYFIGLSYNSRNLVPVFSFSWLITIIIFFYVKKRFTMELDRWLQR